MSETPSEVVDLAVPDESFSAMFALVQDAYSRGRDQRHLGYPMDEEGVSALVQPIARPVVVAARLALAEKVAALENEDIEHYGWDVAIGEVRELIADRCGELGTRVEEL